jgi:hypothetical protein
MVSWSENTPKRSVPRRRCTWPSSSSEVRKIDSTGKPDVGVGLAAFGWLNPLLAAFIHVSSELAFILNSARLLPGSSSQAAGRIAAGQSAPAAFCAE